MVRGYKGVREFIPYGPTQLQEMIKQGRLRPPIKIGPRAIAWFEDDLIAAQEALANYVPPKPKTKSA
jgi:predicted DNA-binding transcriptional regulator AlpA